ncbi:hypothetical protein AMJ44_02755 [candidate division WOR-1 bacterium DG_54_3]|uniref:Deoxyhypusine synthase n=1 Tax=candidate division WOR-1 bacterium DG_54_3 TaxID=1703775 RepID=A0A0S7Y4W6_UNCSA|nr:MAG: hypothetical protein AMJ44_02755 [candidate division WOR-1 bacterium DG_54_3]
MTSEFLKKPTVPIRIGPGKTANLLLQEMLATGFQGKNLAECFEVWKEMLSEEEITIWLGIAGAVVPAGMRRAIAYLVEKRMVDVIVSTGAQMFHDACECLGVKHFQGSPLVDDIQLEKEGIDRFYNVYAKEQEQRGIDRQIQKFLEKLKPNFQYSSREFFEVLGKYLGEVGEEKDSILVQAERVGVPVYAPALNDSSFGYSFIMARHGVIDSPDGKVLKKSEENIVVRFIDQMKDTDETAQIASACKKSGVIYLGGGVPKNFIQQTELLNLIMGRDLPGHEYAIQITTDTPHFGGLSGCTFEEGQSWGKIAKAAKKVQCFCDLTIALPILVHGLAEHEELAAKRKKPHFDWEDSRQVKVVYR